MLNLPQYISKNLNFNNFFQKLLEAIIDETKLSISKTV